MSKVSVIPEEWTNEPWNRVLETDDLLWIWAGIVIISEGLIIGIIAIGLELLKQWRVM